jgi:hypothetical protein
VQRRAAGRRSLLQRVNDKFVVKFDAGNVVSDAVARVVHEFGEIYEAQRVGKSKARSALDVAQSRAVLRLADRQEALAVLAHVRACEELNKAHKLELKPKPVAVGDAKDLLGPSDVEQVAAAVAAGFTSQIEDGKRATEELKEIAGATEKDLLAALAPLKDRDDGGELYAKVLDRTRRKLSEKHRLTLAVAPAKYDPSKVDRFRERVRTLVSGAVQAKRSDKPFDLASALERFDDGERAYVAYRVLSTLRGVRGAAPKAKGKAGEKPSVQPVEAVSEPPLPEVADPYAQHDKALESTIDGHAASAMAAIEKRLAEVDAAAVRIARGRIDVNKVEMITKEHARHHLSDPAVATYEKGYLASGMDLGRLKEAWRQAALARGLEVRYDKRADHTAIVVVAVGASNGEPTVVGRLYVDDERFAPSDVVAPRPVFVHRGTGEQYVQDARDLFVRRFVWRSLNTFDNPKAAFGTITIDVDSRRKKLTDERWAEIAQKLPDQQPEAVDAEIWKHQRQKELQGGSPFVSATTTKHPIFGSTAKYFEDPQGMAKIDLALIPKQRVVDTHQPVAYKRITKHDAPDPDMPFQEGVPAWERNSAVRDAMRTRELVIIGSVPSAAVVGFSTPDAGGGRKHYAPDIDYGGARFLDPVKVADEERRRLEWEAYMRQRRGLDEI